MSEIEQSSDLMDCSLLGSSVYGDSPFQGIFPTQESNPRLLCFLHWQVGALHERHLGNPDAI